MQKKTVSLSVSKSPSILDLPDEIINLIYCNLLNFEAKIFRTVCKKFFKISTSNQHLHLYLEDQIDINDVMRMKNIDHIRSLEISERCSISEKISQRITFNWM